MPKCCEEIPMDAVSFIQPFKCFPFRFTELCLEPCLFAAGTLVKSMTEPAEHLSLPILAPWLLIAAAHALRAGLFATVSNNLAIKTSLLASRFFG